MKGDRKHTNDKIYVQTHKTKEYIPYLVLSTELITTKRKNMLVNIDTNEKKKIQD